MMRSVWLCRFAAWAWVLLLLVPPAVAEDAARTPEDEAGYYELMKNFADTFEQIERNYVKDVDRRKLMEAAIQGMMSELDQYSAYISPEDLNRFNEAVEQEFGGVGIQVQLDPKTRMLTVVSPLPGTPAYRAGVLAGDTIVEIEGKPTEGFTIEDAVRVLKGEPGDPVTIGVRHLGSDEIERVTLVRDIIQVATVMGDHYNDDGTWNFMLDPKEKIGYIRLTHFSRRSADELLDALKILKKQGMKALILDLRFNPGGLLTQAVEIADMFLDSGRIVSTKGRNTEERTWDARKAGTWSDFPMAVLVNHYSASASEILSAALQDHNRAVVVGQRTWGKGSVQNVIELEGGASALKLTTASYHRPSGKNIHRFPGAKESDEWGVMPNDGDKVDMSPEQLRKYLDYRRQRDILKKGGPAESDYEDPQLAKALEVIRKKLGLPKSDDAKSDEKKSDAEKAETDKPEKPDAGSAAAPARISPVGTT